MVWRLDRNSLPTHRILFFDFLLILDDVFGKSSLDLVLLRSKSIKDMRSNLDFVKVKRLIKSRHRRLK